MQSPQWETLVTIARHCWRDRIWMKRRGKTPKHIKTPLIEGHLVKHLDGTGPAIGLAPIVPGTSTTRIAVLDFDDHAGKLTWDQISTPVERVAAALRARGFAPVIFRSRGGKGAHLYLLFEAPVEARDVRSLLRTVLADCGFAVGTRGVEHGEVEIFPKQDRVSEDGAGNMFILPYAGESELLEEELF